VVLIRVLHHIADPERVLKIANKLLNENQVIDQGLVIDTVSPNIIFTSIFSNPVSTGSVMLNYKTDEPLAQLPQALLNDQAMATRYLGLGNNQYLYESEIFINEDAKQGTVDVRVFVKDLADNAQTSVFTGLKIDTEPPLLEALNVTPNPTKVGTVFATVTANETLTVVPQLYINNYQMNFVSQANNRYDYSYNVQLSDRKGTADLKILLTDLAGNDSLINNKDLIIDTQSPEIVFTGVTSLTISERKPIEVVTHIRKQGTHICLIVSSMLSRFAPDTLTS